MRPRSVTGLLLASFTLVALPLLIATLYGVFYVNRLSNQSQQLVLNGVRTARASKKLDTLLTDMERDARQYRILGQSTQVQHFKKHKSQFLATLNDLRALQLHTVPSWNLDTLAAQVRALTAVMHEGPAAVPGGLWLFDSMHQEVALIMQQGNIFIDTQLKHLQSTAEHARRFLLLCLIMLVPGALILAIIFTVVISRPVRQITRAINHLGAGDFSRPIHVSAPSAELDKLGRQLDWMRRQLATLETERNQFLRHMSHELKTPLASIREGAELLHDGTVGHLDSSQAEVADIIHHNSLDLMRLIENLLDFSAWQRQQVQLDYTNCDLQALATAVINRQKLSIESKKLTVLPPDQSIQVNADRGKIYLVMDNLLSNAVKFSPNDAVIRIHAWQHANRAIFSVCDAGPGITPAERDLIFEAFYQGANRDGDSRIRGTGIGLSVVSECVHAHGGTIEINDNRDGGTCFCVKLPEGDLA